jgi:hypothetical protein
MTEGMNYFEKMLAADLLEKAGEKFGNHGCNDYDMPNTDQAYQLLVDFHKWNGDPQDTPERPTGPTIHTSDFIIMYALAARLRGQL